MKNTKNMPDGRDLRPLFRLIGILVNFLFRYIKDKKKQSQTASDSKE